MFRWKESIYTCINCAPTDFVDLQSNGVDVLVNDIQEYLVEIEIIDNLLREDRHLKGGGEYAKWKQFKSLKVGKYQQLNQHQRVRSKNQKGAN